MKTRTRTRTRTTTTIILWPFVWDYPGELVPEDTFTHPPSWSSSKRVWKVLVCLEGVYRLGINGGKTTADSQSADKCLSKQRECACVLACLYNITSHWQVHVLLCFTYPGYWSQSAVLNAATFLFTEVHRWRWKNKTGEWSSLVRASSTPGFSTVLWCCWFGSRRASGP